jgi:diamine N-acetyltransferase
MEIVNAGIEDIPTIQFLAETIWPKAYSDIISATQLRYMLDLFYSKNALTIQIEKGHLFILAKENDTAIGFASFSQKSVLEKHIFRLHKIYVLPYIPTKGIGSYLLSHICNTSKQAGASSLELNVNKYNTAKLFYEKKGFNIISEEVIDIGQGFVMDDYVMMKLL